MNLKMVAMLAKRDFTTRATRAPYIITTLIGMLVFIGLAFAPLIFDHLGTAFDSTELDVLVFDNSETFFPYLEYTAQEMYSTSEVRFTLATDLTEVQAYQRVLDENMTGLLFIDPPQFVLATSDSTNLVQNTQLEGLLNQALTGSNAAQLGLSNEQLSHLFSSAELVVRQISGADGTGDDVDFASHSQAMGLAYFMLFMIYMTLIMYGNMVASGVAEEKSSRIMEVMIATVKPLELMFGKIIGIGALGLLQFTIWISTAISVIAIQNSGLFGQAAAGLGVIFAPIPLSLLVWFILFFLLGYFLYASIFAAAGAIVSRVEDVNQVVTILMFLIIAGFFAAFMAFANPNGTIAVVTSLVPFTAPMVMFARLALGNPPTVHVIASISLLIGAIIISAWISARIYRVGVLLYGKRPTIKEVTSLMK